MKIMAVIVVLLAVALGVQSLRVANFQTELAVLQGDLDAANTSVALLEEDKKTASRSVAGLQEQVEQCERVSSRAAEAARDRAAIRKNSSASPAAAGKEIDNDANRAALRHINRAVGR